MLLHMDELVGSIDQENLRIVVEELGQAFEGPGDDLGRLIDNGDLLLARAEESLPQTLRLITDGQTVLDDAAWRAARRSSSGRPTCGWSPTPSSTWTPTCASIVVNAPDAGEPLQALVEDAGPGLGSLVRNLDILNEVEIPRLDGVEQMLVTYPDAVSGGFTVVRRDDDGVMRSHFGFVVNAGDPHACQTGYVPTSAAAQPRAPSRTSNVDAVECRVVNGVDPNPGDGYDENGSNIRGEQNIGRDGGRAPAGRRAQTGGSRRSPTVLDELLGGLLHANPFARTLG